MVNIEELAKEARMKDYEKLKGYDDVDIDEIDVESNCPSSATSKKRATVTKTKSLATLKASRKRSDGGLKATQAETKGKPSLKKIKTVDVTQSCDDGTKKKKKVKKPKKASREAVKKEGEHKEEVKLESPHSKATPTTGRSEVSSAPTLPTPTVQTPLNISNSFAASRHSHMDAPKETTGRSHYKRVQKRQEKECCCSIL